MIERVESEWRRRWKCDEMSHLFELCSSLCYNHKQTLLTRSCTVQLEKFLAHSFFSLSKPRELIPNKQAAARKTNAFHSNRNLVSKPEHRDE